MEVLSAPSPTMHQMRRNNRGRVAGKRPSALVTDAQAMRAYVREVQGRVGTAKDGWADAAADCGGTQGLPAWASTRHAERHGGADVRETDAGPVVTLRNEVPWIRQVLPEGEEQTAVGIAEERLMKRMETILRKQD